MSLNAYQKACASYFALLVVAWAVLYFGNIWDMRAHSYLAFAYGLMPLLGGILAMVGYRTWGGLSTTLGKAILLLGFGLFLWGAGETARAYYTIVAMSAVPYPSIADIFFAPSVLFYTLGVIYLSRTTGVSFGFRSKAGKSIAVIAPIVALVVAYYIIQVLDASGIASSAGSMAMDGALAPAPMAQGIARSILAYAYPIGDFVSLAVSLVVAGLSFRYLGSKYKYDIMSMLAGLVALFFAHSLFMYSPSHDASHMSHWGHLMFIVGLFFMTNGLLGFNKIKREEAVVAD